MSSLYFYSYTILSDSLFLFFRLQRVNLRQDLTVGPCAWLMILACRWQRGKEYELKMLYQRLTACGPSYLFMPHVTWLGIISCLKSNKLVLSKSALL
jgi:hypothetical protein